MSNTSATSNEKTADQKLETFMKQQEIKGEQQVQDLKKSKGINTDKPLSTVNAIGAGVITEKDITNILQQGFDEFYKETGRNMSYGEMRDMYG